MVLPNYTQLQKIESGTQADSLFMTVVDSQLWNRLFDKDDVNSYLSSLLVLKGFIKNVLRVIEEFTKSKIRAALRELARRTEAIKALHKPLLIVPHSLHPDEAAA